MKKLTTRELIQELLNSQDLDADVEIELYSIVGEKTISLAGINTQMSNRWRLILTPEEPLEIADLT